MSTPHFSFEGRSMERQETYRFYDDRIEMDWIVAFRRGKEIYPVDGISGLISEQTTIAYGMGKVLRRAAVSLLVALILREGFSSLLLNRIGILFFAGAGLFAIGAVTKLKRETWMYVKKTNGGTLLTIRETGLKGVSRSDIFREIQRYVRKPNQSLEATPTKVTPEV